MGVKRGIFVYYYPGDLLESYMLRSYWTSNRICEEFCLQALITAAMFLLPLPFAPHFPHFSMPSCDSYSLITSPKHPRHPLLQIKQTLPKQPIRPAKPLPRPIPFIKRINTLVNQPQSSRRTDELCERDLDFGGGGGREDAHDAGHGPRVAEGDVWAANPDIHVRESWNFGEWGRKRGQTRL
jgi:hypothetical protein